MHPTANNNEKIAPEHSSVHYTIYLAILIIVLQVLVAIVTYPFLPPMVPSHWNAAGQVDSYSPKLFNAILFPAMSIGIYVLLRVLNSISPRLGNQSQRANKNIINLFLVGILLFMLIVQLATTAIALGAQIDITMIISLALSVLFIFLGNYMGKLRRNFWGGIRTPWTITNETVWERTHRFAGILFVGGGVLGVAVSFLPFIRLYGIIVIALVASFLPVIYSYIVYQRVVVRGNQSLSPPFNDEGNGPS
jgi:immunity protein, SdpI family